MPEYGTAVILAGGESRRMGFDKQFLSLNRERVMNSVIEKLNMKFSEIIIVTNKPVFYSTTVHKVVTDEIAGKGPLSGIHIGLKNSSSKYVYFIACDMPVVNTDYIEFMKNRIDDEKKLACITLTGK